VQNVWMRLLLLMGLAGLGWTVEDADTIQPDARAERRYIDTLLTGLQSFQKSDAAQQPLWQGFMPTQVPTLFVFDNGNMYATQMQDPTAVWQPLNGLQSHVTFHTLKQSLDKIEPLKYVAMTKIKDQDFFVFHVQQENFENSYVQRSLYNIVKKEFQEYLRMKIPIVHDIKSVNNPSVIRSNRIAIEKLMQEKLSDYVRTSDVDALRDYLVLSQEQVRLMKDDERNYQNAMLLKEGLTHYVAIQTVDYFFHTKNTAPAILEKLDSDLRTENVMQWMFETHYAGIGSGLAFALDSLGVVDWRSHIDSVTLNGLLAVYLAITPEEKQTRISTMLEGPHFKDLVRLASAAITRTDEATDQVFADFSRSSELQIAVSGEIALMQVGSATENYYTLGVGPLLRRDFLGVVQSADQSIWIELNKTPLLIEPGNAFAFHVGKNFSISVNEHENIPITGAAVWIRPFDAISWDTEDTHGRIKAKGQIISGKEGLKINLLGQTH